MTTTYRLIDIVRDLRTDEETRIVLSSGLAKGAARRQLALRRLSNVVGADALALGRSQVAQMEAETA